MTEKIMQAYMKQMQEATAAHEKKLKNIAVACLRDVLKARATPDPLKRVPVEVIFNPEPNEGLTVRYRGLPDSQSNIYPNPAHDKKHATWMLVARGDEIYWMLQDTDGTWEAEYIGMRNDLILCTTIWRNNYEDDRQYIKETPIHIMPDCVG